MAMVGRGRPSHVVVEVDCASAAAGHDVVHLSCMWSWVVVHYVHSTAWRTPVVRLDRFAAVSVPLIVAGLALFLTCHRILGYWFWSCMSLCSLLFVAIGAGF